MWGLTEIPWENTEKHIQSGHRNTDEFQTDTIKTIMMYAEKGVSQAPIKSGVYTTQDIAVDSFSKSYKSIKSEYIE